MKRLLIALIAATALLLPARAALGTTDGPRYGSSFVDQFDHDGSWADPSNANTNDAAWATATLSTTEVTNGLLCTGFGFTLPAGAVIDGITVAIVRKAENDAPVIDDSIYDVTVELWVSGSAHGANKAKTTTPWPKIEVSTSYGGAADLWSTTWTAADINDSTFGVYISAVCGPDEVATNTVYVNTVTITVTYTVADCNTNNTHDPTETGYRDCNSNSTWDFCDIQGAVSADCNTNDTSDECETDANHNGTPDDCDTPLAIRFDPTSFCLQTAVFYPIDVVQASGIGFDGDWASTNNASSNDSLCATFDTSQLDSGGGYSNPLLATFDGDAIGAVIPPGALICGAQIVVMGHAGLCLSSYTGNHLWWARIDQPCLASVTDAPIYYSVLAQPIIRACACNTGNGLYFMGGEGDFTWFLYGQPITSACLRDNGISVRVLVERVAGSTARSVAVNSIGLTLWYEPPMPRPADSRPFSARWGRGRPFWKRPCFTRPGF